MICKTFTFMSSQKVSYNVLQSPVFSILLQEITNIFMAVKKKKRDPIRLNRLKVVLVEKNISQTELAAMVNRDRNSISRVCNNITQPSLKLLYEMAFAINVDVRNLLVPGDEIKEIFLKEKKKD